MATNDEWEYSKENIQPLQQGRKPEVLKRASCEQLENEIHIQRQAFENELRTYSGEDPLSVWCKYIHWVEQNFLKGGRDGHIEELIRKCINIFKDEKRYYDDKRFVAIWLKFANAALNPTEIFSYMYSHNIGCRCAIFFIAWSWELEQLENTKKAHQVLREGLNRKADPIESLKSYISEFEIRIARKIVNTEGTTGVDNYRSAFNVLKPHKKSAPVERVGESVIEPNRTSLTIGRKQPATKTNLQAPKKQPFKMHNTENTISSLPVQTKETVPFMFHQNSSKENEAKPSKWNKVKYKPMIPVPRISSSNLGFDFHCDETPQPVCTPRSVPKVSNVLRSRHEPKSPLIALFEPPDPKKRPMYDKNKVYGGAEEFSFEEIRAAEWLKKHSKKARDNFKNERHAKTKSSLWGNFENPLRALKSPINLKRRPIYDRNKFYENKEEISFEEIKANIWFDHKRKMLEKSKESDLMQKYEYKMFENVSRENSMEGKPSVTEILQGKHSGSASFYEAHDLIQQLYNGTLSNLQKTFANEFVNKDNDLSKHLYVDIQKVPNKDSLPLSYQHHIDKETFPKHANIPNDNNNMINLKTKADIPFTFYQDFTENKIVERDNIQFKTSKDMESQIKPELPFTFFCDATEINSTTKSNSVSNSNSHCLNVQGQSDSPFVLYEDITQTAPEQNNTCSQILTASKVEAVPKNEFLHTVDKESPEILTIQEQMFGVSIGEIYKDREHNFGEENIENIPPKDYVEDKTKREISGILTMAKDIEFIPLEEQQQSEEECSESDDSDVVETNDLLPNLTLIPPCNTEQFVSAQFFSSTPCTTAKNVKKPNSRVSTADTYNYGLEPSCTMVENLNTCPPPNISDNFISRQKSEKNTFVRPCNLSVIIETSKESYKSSTSSGSSASVTKLSQFDHLLSYDKSNTTHKEASKIDTFKEPKPLEYEANVSNAKPVIDELQQYSHKQQIFKLQNYDNDPFNITLNNDILQSLNQPSYLSVLEISENPFKSVSINDTIKIKDASYFIKNLIAEGAYGKVFTVKRQEASFQNFDKDLLCSKFALKVCKHVNEWELYICSILNERLQEIKGIDVQKSVMNIIAAKKFKGGLMLVTDYFQRGTLLDLVNLYKIRNVPIPQQLIMYLVLELLQTVSEIHKCKIIHADIKPDNILVQNFPLDLTLQECFQKNIHFLHLIDFGRSIDLNFLEEGITFTTSLKTNRCMTVLENKPWVFEPDWYGVLDCVHTLLFSEYMKVRQTENGKWGITKKIPRYWPGEIWTPLFDELLNIPDCYKEPNISEHVNRIKEKLLQNVSAFKHSLGSLYSLFKK